MYKDERIASTVAQAENCLYDIKDIIEANGSSDQQEILLKAMDVLEELYYSLS